MEARGWKGVVLQSAGNRRLLTRAAQTAVEVQAASFFGVVGVAMWLVAAHAATVTAYGVQTSFCLRVADRHRRTLEEQLAIGSRELAQAREEMESLNERARMTTKLRVERDAARRALADHRRRAVSGDGHRFRRVLEVMIDRRGADDATRTAEIDNLRQQLATETDWRLSIEEELAACSRAREALARTLVDAWRQVDATGVEKRRVMAENARLEAQVSVGLQAVELAEDKVANEVAIANAAADVEIRRGATKAAQLEALLISRQAKIAELEAAVDRQTRELGESRAAELRAVDEAQELARCRVSLQESMRGLEKDVRAQVALRQGELRSRASRIRDLEAQKAQLVTARGELAAKATVEARLRAALAAAEAAMVRASACQSVVAAAAGERSTPSLAVHEAPRADALEVASPATVNKDPSKNAARRERRRRARALRSGACDEVCPGWVSKAAAGSHLPPATGAASPATGVATPLSSSSNSSGTSSSSQVHSHASAGWVHTPAPDDGEKARAKGLEVGVEADASGAAKGLASTVTTSSTPTTTEATTSTPTTTEATTSTPTTTEATTSAPITTRATTSTPTTTKPTTSTPITTKPTTSTPITTKPTTSTPITTKPTTSTPITTQATTSTPTTTQATTSTPITTKPTKAMTTTLIARPRATGLRNSGNQCSLNSVVQLLRGDAALLAAVSRTETKAARACSTAELSRREARRAARMGTKRTLTDVLASSFQSMACAQAGEACYLQRKAFKDLLRLPIGEDTLIAQADAGEVLCKVLNLLCQEGGDVGAAAKSMTGQATCRASCSCGQVSDSVDPFTTLNVPMAAIEGRRGAPVTLESLLGEMFSKAEDIPACTTCEGKDGQTRRSESRLSGAPDRLLIQLNRFRWTGYECTKVEDLVKIPLILDTSPYTSVGGGSIYHLDAVLHHATTSASQDLASGFYRGHFFIFVRDPERSWTRVDDAHVSKATEREALNEGAYILSFAKRPS